MDLEIQYNKTDPGSLTLKGIIEATFPFIRKDIIDMMRKEGISKKVSAILICLGQTAFESEIVSQKLMKWSDEDLIYGVTIVDGDGSKTSFLAIRDDYKQRFLRLRDSLFYYIVSEYVEQILFNVFYTLPKNKIRNMMEELGSSMVDAVVQNLSAENIKD